MTGRAPAHRAVHRGGGAAPHVAPRLLADDAAPAVVTRHALRAMAVLASARLEGPDEQLRLALLGEALRAAQRLNGRLADLTRHAIAESRGSHSAWDLGADADATFAALRECAEAIEAIADAVGPAARDR